MTWHLKAALPARWHALSPRARRALVAGVVLAITGGVVWGAIAADRDEAARPLAAPRAGDMPGMKGMAGMDMSSGGSMQLTSGQLREFGVTFGTVDVRMLESEVRTVGSVTLDETRIAQVAPKFGGFVERLYVNFTGQPVQRGQPLLEVYSPELVAAQQELLVARRLERTLDESSVPGVPRGSTDLLAAARRRLELWDISDAQIDEILRAGRAQRTLTLHAPVSGTVIEKNVVQGQAIAPGQQLYTIADLYRVWVDVQVREADAAYVRPGTAADLELAAMPGRVFKGIVEIIYPVLDTTARAVRARVGVTNSEGLLRPGMYATVRLRAPQRPALTVPASAVVRTGERNVVFVGMGGGRIMPHDVELGRTAGEYTEILAGLEPGQLVVTSAQFLLDSESNLAEVMRSMMGQMGSGDVGNMKDMPGMSMPGMDKGADMRTMPGMKTLPPSTTPRR